MRKRFAVIDHTADIGIAAYGADLREAFANAAYGLFSLITEPRKLKETLTREIEVEGEDAEDLLVAWLNEFIFLFDAEYLLFRRFAIEELTETHLKAKAYGERFDPRRHPMKRGIKAVTRHMLSSAARDGVEARVLFDI